MSRIVPIEKDDERPKESCAACRSDLYPRYTTRIESIIMVLCINWKECCVRLDAMKIKEVQAACDANPSYQDWKSRYTHDR